MKQMLIPKRGDLIVLYVGLSLLACAVFPAAVLVDHVRFAFMFPAMAGFAFWSPLVFALISLAYSCLLAWTAFSQSHWLKRFMVFTILLSAGLAVMWLSAFLTHVIDRPRIPFKKPVLVFVLLGMAGLPLLLAMKYLMGIQLLHGEQVAKPPKLRLFLIGAAIVMIPAFYVSAQAQQTRDANLETAATISSAGGVVVTCLIGIPVWILSRKWKKRIAGITLATYLLVLCALPIGNGILIERSGGFPLGTLSWGTVYASVAFILVFWAVMFTACHNGYRLVALPRQGGRWQVANENEVATTLVMSGRWSLSPFACIAVALSGFLYFEKHYDLPVFTFSKFGEKLRNARFAKELQGQYASFDDYDDKGYFLNNRLFALDPNLRTIKEITIRLDLPGADPLIADLKTLGDIPKVGLSGPPEYNPRRWEPALFSSRQLEELANGANISSVTFFFVRFDHSVNAKLPKMESVEFSHTANTDALIEELAETNSLKSLSLFDTDLTESGLDKIKSMTNLRKLNIFHNNNIIESKSLQGISRLEQLETLSLRSIKVDDASLEEVAQIQNLRELYLGTVDSTISEQGAQYLLTMPKLKTVELDGGLTPKVFGRLKSAAAFSVNDAMYQNRILGAPSNRPRSFGAQFIANDWLVISMEKHGGDLVAALEDTASKIERDAGGNVVELEFDNVWISDEGLDQLSELSALRSLDLESSMYPNASAGLQVQGGLGETFESTDLTGESLVQFGMQKKLERLRLPRVMIDDSVFVGLTEIPTQTEISFDPALVSDDLYPKLTDLPELKQVRLLSGRVEASLIKQLQSMSQIEEVVIVAPTESGLAKTYAEQAEKDLKTALDGKTIRIETRRQAEK